MTGGRVVPLDLVREVEAGVIRALDANPSWLPRWSRALQRKLRREIVDHVTQEQNAQLVVRLSQALLDRVDAHAERLREQIPGSSWKRADVVRLLLTQALDAAEPKKTRKK